MLRSSYCWTLAAGAFVIAAQTALAGDLAGRQAATMASQGMNNSAAYNGGFGMGSAGENLAASGRVRDSANNLSIVNGVMGGGAAYAGAGATASASASSSSYSRQEGLVTSAGATAIGNNLNINVIGNWNTVIVDSTQINNGDQNATATLNGQLKL